jgi:hypothetical protein
MLPHRITEEMKPFPLQPPNLQEMGRMTEPLNLGASNKISPE